MQMLVQLHICCSYGPGWDLGMCISISLVGILV